MRGVGIKLVGLCWETASPSQVRHSILLILSFLCNVVLSTDRWASWVVDFWSLFLQCRGWEEVSWEPVRGGILSSGQALVICQPLWEVGRLTALPGAISISCSLRCWPVPSLGGGVAEEITWVGSSSYLTAN